MTRVSFGCDATINEAMTIVGIVIARLVRAISMEAAHYGTQINFKQMKVDLQAAKITDIHNYLLSLVTPRPIAFASTIDKDGNVNLSPFSFFNAFSANPPILIFSPSRRGRDNTTKHTWENVNEVPEVVINIVNYDIVQQMSLSSSEFAKGVNEFGKSGLTEVPSELVKPPRVKESPASIECKVIELKPLGDQGGAGQLVICEALMIHINETILDDQNKIDPRKLDAVGRSGGNWYARAFGDALFEVPKPTTGDAIGIDNMPEAVRNSKVLTGNDLGMLGNVKSSPDHEEVIKFSEEPEVISILEKFSDDPAGKEIALHQLAKFYLEQHEVEAAWKVLMQ